MTIRKLSLVAPEQYRDFVLTLSYVRMLISFEMSRSINGTKELTLPHGYKEHAYLLLSLFEKIRPCPDQELLNCKIACMLTEPQSADLAEELLRL